MAIAMHPEVVLSIVGASTQGPAIAVTAAAKKMMRLGNGASPLWQSYFQIFSNSVAFGSSLDFAKETSGLRESPLATMNFQRSFAAAGAADGVLWERFSETDHAWVTVSGVTFHSFLSR